MTTNPTEQSVLGNDLTESEDKVVLTLAHLSEAIKATHGLEALTVEHLHNEGYWDVEGFKNPQVFAFLIMSTLDNTESLTVPEREFWFHVAMTMGPDWIAKFRRVGVFMNAVDKA